MVVSVLSIIVIMAVATLMADSQKGFNRIYDKTNCDVAQDEYAIRSVFPSIIRQGSTADTATTIGTNSEYVQIKYYASASSTELDRYAKFYIQDNELILEKGVIDPAETLSLQTVAKNIDQVKFAKIGKSVQMFVVLNDQERSREILTSAVLNNP